MKKVLLICGVSGSGKSYITNNLVNLMPNKYNKLIQYTTRKRRPEETNNDYYFITENHFLNIKNSLMAINYMNGNYYGTIPDLDDNKISIIIVNDQGLKSSKEYLDNIKDSKVRVLLLNVDTPYKEREDYRDINKEYYNLINTINDIIPQKDYIELNNNKDNPLDINLLDKKIEDLFNNEFEKCENNYIKLSGNNLFDKCNKSKIECPWVLCKYNDGEYCNNPNGIKLVHVTVNTESLDEDLKDSEYIDDSLLNCASYEYDEKWTRKINKN